MAALPADAAAEGIGPLMHFNGRLPLEPGQPVPARDGRHLALVLKEPGKPLHVSLHLLLHNMGLEREHLLTVYGPDGRRIGKRTFVTDSGQTNPQAKQGTDFEVAADSAAGVYAFVVRTIAPVALRASSGKVVHYMPPGRRAFCSAVWGGQAWFEPLGDEEVLFGDPSGFPKGQVTIFDPGGRAVAASRIAGTTEVDAPSGRRQLPSATPCRFQPDPQVKGLYSFVCANIDWHGSREIRGTKPWIAAQRDEWFDPNEYPCPGLEQRLLQDAGEQKK
jgi:hypothetical protein